MSEQKRSWDYKSIGAGGISVAALLTLLQGQGITLMNKSQEEKNVAVLERVIKTELKDVEHEARLNRLERSLEKINQTVSRGHEKQRELLAKELGKIYELIRVGTQARWTKEDHERYADYIERKIKSLKLRIQEIEKN